MPIDPTLATIVTAACAVIGAFIAHDRAKYGATLNGLAERVDRQDQTIERLQNAVEECRLGKHEIAKKKNRLAIELLRALDHIKRLDTKNSGGDACGTSGKPSAGS